LAATDYYCDGYIEEHPAALEQDRRVKHCLLLLEEMKSLDGDYDDLNMEEIQECLNFLEDFNVGDLSWAMPENLT
jgi:hypothetical protein